MNLRRITYIGLIALLAASCAKEQLGEQTLSGTGEKTPLTASVLMQAGQKSAGTKAADMAFENGDTFVAYLRHVTWNGPDGDRTLVSADKSPLLVTFTKGNEAMAAYPDGHDITPIGTGVALGLTSGNTKQTSDLTASPALYWDDFSDSSSADKDLRTSGHYLESFYGYCYNGGTPSTALTETTGVLGWTVQADQTDGIKTSDLLWSAEQEPVPYAHTTPRAGLKLPYTHAMSKVTIELVLNEGFDVYTEGENTGKAKAFVDQNTTPILYANRVTTTTAPTYTHSTTVAAGDARKIQMRLADDETVLKSRVYEAVIAPTVMKAGNLLAQVTVDGNSYDIKLTNAVLTTDPKDAGAAWSSQLKAYSIAESILTKNSSGDYSAENGGITLPGVNYRIKVTLNKQKIDVVAYITNWTDVNAAVDGTIMFDADVVSDNATGTAVTATSFDLYRSLTNTDADSYDADGDSDGIQKASTYTYNTDKWVGDPLLYWINGSTPYYFRALAKVENPSTEPNVITSVGGSQDATQGVDLLWAQTSAHTGTTSTGASVTYAAGAAINPRTGNVPLTFEHAMSKISVLLKTDKDASGADIPPAAQVVLAGAKISIINLYNGGTIDVKTGEIVSLTSPLDAEPAGNPYTIENAEVAEVGSVYGWRNNIVIPQSLTQDRDGTLRQATVYYQPSELTAIYANADTSYETEYSLTSGITANTSIGTGAATYYLTNELEHVDAVNFTDDDIALINSHNAGLPGHITTDDVKTAARTKVEFDLAQFNADHLHKNITSEQFASLPDDAKLKTPVQMYTWEEYKELKPYASMTRSEFEALPDNKKTKTAAVYYTQAEIDAAKAIIEAGGYVQGTNPEAEDVATKTTSDIKTAAVLYTLAEYQNLQPYSEITEGTFNALQEADRKKADAEYYSYDEYIALDVLTDALFNALPDGLVVVSEVKYTAEEVKTHNDALPGAWQVGEVKVPAHYKLPATPLTSHAPGDLKTAGNKIMLYVTLADGTRYGVDLATCKDSSDNLIPAWERGKHYTYTISLAKEQITFRALIKDWDEKTGSGNATLEWD